MSPAVFSASGAAAAPRWGDSVSSMFGSPARSGMMCVAMAAVLLLAGPSELPELVIGVLGAVVYAMYQTKTIAFKKTKSKQKVVESTMPEAAAAGVRPRHVSETSGRRSMAKPRSSTPKNEFRQESVVPVVQATFQSVGWEGEVQELLQQIRPNVETDKLVHALAQAVERALRPLVPEAEVVSCACGNAMGKKAFGVAVPEVDIVVTVSPDALISRLRSRLPNGAYLAKLDAKKLQKAAIRACADQLVSLGGFKFRRSAFRGEEPKFTLVAPSALGAGDGTTAIDFSVNSATPLQAAAVFRECAKLDPRAVDLILLLRRWARDRGISHAARGHLSPYCWTLLAIYFLQVGVEEAEDGAMMPAMGSFTSSKKSSLPAFSKGRAPELTPAVLFKRCLQFYAGFDWRHEAVSVRSGRRGPPEFSLPVHVTVSDDGKATRVAPSIEDPFNGRRNLASCMAAEGVARLHEELARASALCSQERPLGELLELWAPPELATASAEGMPGADSE